MLILNKTEDFFVETLQDSHCILLGGDIVNEKRYLWWNFVSSEMELIENAKKNWLNKKFKMPVDDYKDFIPLPN